jgi:hypothetical protein
MVRFAVGDLLSLRHIHQQGPSPTTEPKPEKGYYQGKANPKPITGFHLAPECLYLDILIQEPKNPHG